MNSNLHDVESISKVQRYSRAEKVISVRCPKIVSRYNKFIGGTDQMDQNVNAYKIGIRGKKWWWSVFTWTIDVSLQNAWLVHREANQRMSLLEFRRSIAIRYLSIYTEVPIGAGRPKLSKDSSIVSRVADEVRLDSSGRLIQNEKSNIRRRWDGHLKSAQSAKKWDVDLCVPCFANFHS